MRTGRQVEVSVFALLGLVQRFNLGEPHLIFAGGERYVSPRFSEVAEGVAREELERAGLGDSTSLERFAGLLEVVQRASLEFYGWVTTADESYTVLVASYGKSAVLVVRSGERVRFEVCDPERMVEALVWRLPDVGVASGDAFSVRHIDFHARGGRADGGVMRRSSGSRVEGARRLDALLKARRVGVGKIYAARRDSAGVRERSERWLTVLDLVDGRWALSVAPSRGERWIYASPGTHSYIGDRLLELAR